ncbi:MAG: hypothetical protein ABI367_09575 [Mucilaginibacter sp.]
MKKLFTNSNPFILLLAPVVFAVIMGASYQLEQKKQSIEACAPMRTTSHFVKGITLVKTVCSIAKPNLW